MGNMLNLDSCFITYVAAEVRFKKLNIKYFLIINSVWSMS